MSANYKYGTRGKYKLQSAQTSQVSATTINATHDVTTELNDIMVDLPSNQGNTVSPSAMRVASREREMKNKRVARNIPSPSPRPPVLKNKVSSVQKNPVAKAKKTVVLHSSQASNTESSSSEGELKTS